MSTNEQVFKNDHINVAVSKQPGSKIKMEVTVSPKAVAAAYNKALKAINKEVSLPGFRKGKAPTDFILKKFGKQVEQEWREIVMQTSFQEALSLTNMYPLRNNEAKCTGIKDLSMDKEAQLTIEFEALPEIPAISLSEMKLQNVERRPISQPDIDQVIGNIQAYLAPWTDITDRPVQEGDYIDLDIDKLDEPVENICEDTRFTVEEGKMAPWMHKLVLGTRLNESVEGTSERDPNQPEEPNFQPTRCRITIKAIKTTTLPEVNDELAKKVGAASLTDLYEKITADLNRRADTEVREQLRRQIDAILLERYHFDIPQSILDEEQKSRKENTSNWLKQQNAPKDVIRDRLKEMEGTLPGEVERSYRLFFLIHNFAREHNIEVTNDEITHELRQQMMQGMSPAFQGLNTEQIQSRLAEQILLRKSRDYIIDHVKKT